jgi:hypothetical protein
VFVKFFELQAGRRVFEKSKKKKKKRKKEEQLNILVLSSEIL